MKSPKPLFLIHFASLVSTMMISISSLCGAEVYEITKIEIPFEYTLRGEVRAEETTPIKSAVSWKPVRFVVPDGSYVSKGQKIVEFDPLEQHAKYEKMLIQKNVVDLELKGRLLTIDDKSQKFADQIKEKEGRLLVLKAKLKRLKSMPLKTDVAIAKGKLRVAKLELDAAQKDWEKAKQRFDKGFLSKTELQRYDHALKRKQAEIEHKSTTLSLVDKPAEAWDVETVELQIKNAELELEKLRFENSKQKEFIEINKIGAQHDAKRFEQRLKRSKEELDKLVINSPTDGYIVYTERFKRDLAENGGKMWRHRIFLNIPHIDGMYIHGIIPEHLRQMIEVGNKCDLYISGADATYIKGEVSFIDKQPKDLKEAKGQIEWGNQQSSGIKVYTIKVKPLGESSPLIKPKAHAMVKIVGKKNLAAAIPSNYVVFKDDRYYASFNGIYEPIEGTPVNGWFQLKDESLIGKKVQLKGTFPLQSADETIVNNDSGQLTLSGEISAVKDIPVRVNHIHRSSKITELVEEGTDVKKGDLLFKLDDTESVEELTKREETLKNKVSEREKAEEELKITELNGNINLKLSRNNVRIAELEFEKRKANHNFRNIANAKLQHTLSKINLQESDSALKRLKNLPADRVSKTEMKKAERDYTRKQLLEERARLQLYISENGIDYFGLKRSERDLLSKRLSLESQEKRLAYELQIARGRIIRAKNSETHHRDRYDDMQVALENLTVNSPADGTVVYNVIWDSGELGKIKKGSTVRRYLNPISIADFSQTMVTLEVPEQAFPHVVKGGSVKIFIPSLGDQEFAGTIAEVDYTFKNKSRKDVDIGIYGNREPLGQAVFVVRIHLEGNNSDLIKPGMQVHVRFPIDWPLRSVDKNAH